MLSCTSTLPRALAGLLVAALSACQAAPPPARIEGAAGVVRAATEAQAREVSTLLERLEPRVASMLPGLREREVEVWVQPAPHLYPFGGAAYEEADGFWAQGAGRIHLRQTAESLERTLAHELVHSMLGESWDRLPGTIEEGLCDWVSAELCPDEAAYMRAGRLSAACFALGGIELELALVLPREEHALGIELGYSARVLLHGELHDSIDPMAVFEVRAGLSTTRMEPAHKKALYGFAYLVVDRIAARRGIEALHELCLRARDEGRGEIPAEWLLEAADIPGIDAETWRGLLRERFGDQELAELIGMYPGLLLDTLQQSFGSPTLSAAKRANREPVELRIALRDGRARLALALGQD